MIQTNKVFTPSTPAKLTFIERESVNTQIVNALSTPGKQLVIYGHSGSGKTTLIINKLNQMYENHITVRCIINMTYEDMILQAFDELNPYYEDSKISLKKDDKSIKLTADYLSIKAEIGTSSLESETNTMKRVLPPALSMQTLARFLGNAQCCLVLEDFHKINNIEKKQLAQTMKLFMDMAEEYSELKIICIGAVDTGREVVQYDPELNNRVAEIQVPLMTNLEIAEIIDTGFKILNMKLPLFLKERIIKLSNGVPSVCHAICLQTCFAMRQLIASKKKIKINTKDLEKGVEGYIQDSSDSIQSDFEKALAQRKGKYKNASLIFKALATFDIDGIDQHTLLIKIKEDEPTYPQGNLSSYLKELIKSEKGSILIKRSNNYCFKSPIYQTYAQYLFGKVHNEQITHDSISFDLELISEKLEYLKDKIES